MAGIFNCLNNIGDHALSMTTSWRNSNQMTARNRPCSSSVASIIKIRAIVISKAKAKTSSSITVGAITFGKSRQSCRWVPPSANGAALMTSRVINARLHRNSPIRRQKILNINLGNGNLGTRATMILYSIAYLRHPYVIKAPLFGISRCADLGVWSRLWTLNRWAAVRCGLIRTRTS